MTAPCITGAGPDSVSSGGLGPSQVLVRRRRPQNGVRSARSVRHRGRLMTWLTTTRLAVLQAAPAPTARQRVSRKKSSSRRAVRARDAWSPRLALVKLSISPDRGGQVVTANGQSNQNPPDEFVLTPGGYRHRSLVHTVEAGVAVEVQDDVIRLRNVETSDVLEEMSPVPTAPGAVPALGSGWITYCYWNNGTGTPLSTFKTMWQVPPPPSVQDSGEVVFLFNGIRELRHQLRHPAAGAAVGGLGGGAAAPTGRSPAGT